MLSTIISNPLVLLMVLCVVCSGATFATGLMLGALFADDIIDFLLEWVP